MYRAVDESLGREVALKVFRTGAEADLTRHQEETRVLASLNHHGIVSLIDAGVDDSDPSERHPFLVMELIEGTNLEEAIASRALNPREISEIAYDLAEALEFVHAHGVLHRDIKPANVMLVEYGTTTSRMRARLTDFGIALDADSPPPTSDDATTGTAAYLSPEQARREEVTFASDVYSLGLVLLQCFTGRLAFPGEAIESALARLIDDPEIPDDLPGEWTALLHSMLARDPATRPPIGELTPAFRQAVIAASARHKERRSASRADDAPTPPFETLDLPVVDPVETPVIGTAATTTGSLPVGDDALDRVTALAARALLAPIAIIALESEDRLWFTARRNAGLDAHTLLDADGAAAAGFALSVVVPLIAADGTRLGALHVLDEYRRDLSEDERATLSDLAAIVVDELELRRQSPSLDPS